MLSGAFFGQYYTHGTQSLLSDDPAHAWYILLIGVIDPRLRLLRACLSRKHPRCPLNVSNISVEAGDSVLYLLLLKCVFVPGPTPAGTGFPLVVQDESDCSER